MSEKLKGPLRLSASCLQVDEDGVSFLGKQGLRPEWLLSLPTIALVANGVLCVSLVCPQMCSLSLTLQVYIREAPGYKAKTWSKPFPCLIRRQKLVGVDAV